MLVNCTALTTAFTLHFIVGVFVVRAYLRSDVKLRTRTEVILMIASGPYGWLLLHRFSTASRRRLKKVSKAIDTGQKK
jgi:hypothetical protein